MSLMSNAGIVLYWPCKRLLLLFSFFANIRVFEKHRNHKWQKVLVFFLSISYHTFPLTFISIIMKLKLELVFCLSCKNRETITNRIINRRRRTFVLNSSTVEKSCNLFMNRHQQRTVCSFIVYKSVFQQFMTLLSVA